MTSTTSSSSFLFALRKRLAGEWWMALLMLLTMLLAGPVLNYFALHNMALVSTPKELAADAHDWLNWSAFIGYYLIAIAFGIICGLVYTAYQHQRRQADLYHSLPIRRGRLCALDLATGTLSFGVSLVVTMLLLLGTVVLTVPMQHDFLVWTGIHLLQVMIFFLASFALTLLAGQLTGHLVSQIEMTVILQFLVTLIGLTGQSLASRFETFVQDQTLNDLTSFSLPGLLVRHGIKIFSVKAGYHTASPRFDNSAWLWLLVVTALALLLSALLTNRRPSERAGQTFIYDALAAPVKIYVLVIVTVLAGLAAATITQAGLLAFLLPAILTVALGHIVYSIAFHRNVRQIGKGWGLTALCLILSVGLFALVEYDVFGYNDRQPATADIKSIALNLRYGPSGAITAQDDINKTQALLEAARSHRLNSKTHAADPDASAEQSTLMTAVWTLHNGHTVMRSYEVPLAVYNKYYGPLYDSQSYRHVLYGPLFDLADINELGAITIRLPNDDHLKQDDEDILTQEKKTISLYRKGTDDKALAKALVEALRSDLDQRSYEDQMTDCLTVLQFDVSPSRQGYADPTFEIPIYPADTHTVALLEDLAASQHRTLLRHPTDHLDQIEALKIVQLDENGEEQKVLATITDKDRIASILTNDTVSITRLVYPGIDIEPRIAVRAEGPTPIQRYLLKGHTIQ